MCRRVEDDSSNEIDADINDRDVEQQALRTSAHAPAPLPSDHAPLSEDGIRERGIAYATEPGPAHPIVLRDLRQVRS